MKKELPLNFIQDLDLNLPRILTRIPQHLMSLGVYWYLG